MLVHVDALIEAGEWKQAMKFAGHGRRGPLVLEHGDRMDDANYWEAVADAWQDSDRSPLTPAAWRTLFNADRPGRASGLMNADEQVALAELPERVCVYRGGFPSGMSWSLDRSQAEMFATRFAERYAERVLVTTGHVLRHRIIALFNARDEREVLVHPRHVYDRS